MGIYLIPNSLSLDTTIKHSYIYSLNITEDCTKACGFSID